MPSAVFNITINVQINVLHLLLAHVRVALHVCNLNVIIVCWPGQIINTTPSHVSPQCTFLTILDKSISFFSYD